MDYILISAIVLFFGTCIVIFILQHFPRKEDKLEEWIYENHMRALTDLALYWLECRKKETVKRLKINEYRRNIYKNASPEKKKHLSEHRVKKN